MRTLSRLFFAGPRVRDVEDAQDEARLENAERDLVDLQDRATKAIKVLDDRQRRNHWREAVQSMIKGAT